MTTLDDTPAMEKIKLKRHIKRIVGSKSLAIFALLHASSYLGIVLGAAHCSKMFSCCDFVFSRSAKIARRRHCFLFSRRVVEIICRQCCCKTQE